MPNVELALEFAARYGGTDGAHHKDWVIDQMVRALTDCPMDVLEAKDCNGAPYTYSGQGESADYRQFVAKAKTGEDGPDTYGWEVGIAP
jgi:hypothetical protein